MNLDTTSVALDNPSMQLPIIHSNGNSGTALGKEYFEALRVLNKFQDAFFAIEFHSRDYYPLGDAAWLKAVEQRKAMHVNINSLRHYLDVHAGHCFESTK